MEGGIAIVLLLFILLLGVGAFMLFGGGAEALRHRRGGDLGPAGGEAPPPVHVLAEPDDEHAVGYGVGGEHGDTPKPARVEDPPPGTERR